MDGEDDSIAYLKFLNDGLTDSFSVEPIFTEIETADDWPAEGFSVFLSGTDEEFSEKSHGSARIITGEILNNAIKPNTNKNEQQKKTIVDSDTTKTTENIYLPTDVFFSEIATLKGDQPAAASIEVKNDQIYNVVNVDGTYTLTKVNIVPDEEEDNKNYDEYYNTVIARKCKFCNFLCESDQDMVLHLRDKHTVLVSNKPVLQSEDGKNYFVKYIKMSSVLNSNNYEGKEKKTLYLCSECSSGYSSKDELKTHMIAEHKLIAKTVQDNDQNKNSEPISNNENHKGNKSLRSLSTFLIKNQEKALKKIKCSISGCNLRFAREDIRQQHEDCHVDENKKQFKCTQCDKKFSIWRICCNHMWKNHKIDLGLLTCPMCNEFKSSSSVGVITHMAIHSEEKPFLCNDCGKSFKQLAQLKNHQVSHKFTEDVPNWYSMKQCEICDRFFANSKSLKKHIQIVHEKFKPFICNICGHKTARKAMLELHLRQHTGQKPHQCPYCPYKTADHNCLRRHVMRHVGEKKYSCPHCSYTSIQSASFKNHVAHKHPGKSGTFSCTYCSYTSVNAASYASHVKCHEIALKSSTDEKDGSNKVEPTKSNTTTSKPDSMQDAEDDETQNCFLNGDQQTDETVDTGGITIPAGLEVYLVS